MWHFPTIHIQQNAVAELQAFLHASLFDGKELSSKLLALPKVRHAVTYRQITLLPFRLDVAELPRVPHSKPLLLSHVSSVPISNLTRKVARAALSAPSAGSLSAKLPKGPPTKELVNRL
jgi:hypothetical protein